MTRPFACMARLALLAVALLMAGVPSGFAGGGDSAFFASMEDVPLMPGLKEVVADSVVFDTPAGRIVETHASGAVSRDGVLSFYGMTLPELGWEPSGPTTFRREGEVLTLDFTDAKASPSGAAGLTVRFTLSPAAESR